MSAPDPSGVVTGVDPKAEETGGSEILQHINSLEKRLQKVETFRNIQFTYNEKHSKSDSTRSTSPVSPIPNHSHRRSRRSRSRSRHTRYHHHRARAQSQYSPSPTYSRSPSPSRTDQKQKDPLHPLITYKIEYIRLNRRGYEEVFDSEVGEEPRPRTQNTDYEPTFNKGPAIEVVRKIRVLNPRRFTGFEKCPTALIINSPYLIDALGRMADFSPALGVLKHSDGVTIREPYQSVVYCLDELRKYEANHLEEEDLAITLSHIKLLLDFISASIGGELEEEKKLNSQAIPFVTWNWLWTIFRPGQVIVSNEGGIKPRAYVTTGVSAAHLSDPDTSTYRGYSSPGPPPPPPPPPPPGVPKAYYIHCWSLKFDGEIYQKETYFFSIPMFQGSKEITSLPVYPLTIPGIWSDKSLSKELLERGKRIYEIHKTSPSHKEYHGWTLDPRPSEIQSRVVIDHECYYQEHTAEEGSHHVADYRENQEYRYRRPRPPSSPRLVPYTPRNLQLSASPRYSTDNTPLSEEGVVLADDEIILITNNVFGWILKDRKWALLDMDYVTDIIPDKYIFDSLILPDDRTEIIKALVQSHKRRGIAAPGQQDIDSGDMTYSADVIKGKGQGLLILLHGPPGVGKTSTAECVAEYTERPLFPITCGDLGTEPKILEEKLQEAFRLAQRWGAVLLLDEADVFLGRRELNDINRNSLVSVFLRVLEYYTGILFLTSNRVGSFDEAFTSRLHVSIHYPRLEEKERSRIWKYHVERLERIRDDLDVRDSVNDYLENNQELKKIMFNGRQIRNIFQTAVSLALYEAKTDQKRKGRPSLRSDHLKKVIKLSCEFQEYLKSTRESDSDKAFDGELRNDRFGKGRP